MSKEQLSTFDELMEDESFKEEFEAGYRDFLLSELIHAMMDEEATSVRKLAEEVGISPTTVQNLRSGKQQDIKLSNFLGIAQACGYRIILEKGSDRLEL